MKKISIINNFPYDTVVKADPNIIATIIRNIINNSIKFTLEGGTIKINYTKTDKEHLISIFDNGVGMKEKTLKNLFQLDKAESILGTNNEKGTGLGLIICKEFIEKINGRIWAESELGIGTTFYFTIPLNN